MLQSVTKRYLPAVVSCACLLLMSDSKDALRRAIAAAGGREKLAPMLGITVQAIWQWDEVPPLRVLAVERATGVPRHELRPDLYPPAEASP